MVVIKIVVIKIKLIRIEVIKIEVIKIEVSGCLARLTLCFRQDRVSYVVFKLIVRVAGWLGGWVGGWVAGWPDQLKIRTTQLN